METMPKKQVRYWVLSYIIDMQFRQSLGFQLSKIQLFVEFELLQHHLSKQFDCSFSIALVDLNIPIVRLWFHVNSLVWIKKLIRICWLSWNDLRNLTPSPQRFEQGVHRPHFVHVTFVGEGIFSQRICDFWW